MPTGYATVSQKGYGTPFKAISSKQSEAMRKGPHSSLIGNSIMLNELGEPIANYPSLD
jgi:hypothetical protein